MIELRKVIGLVLIAGGVSTGLPPRSLATPPSSGDVFSTGRPGDTADTVDVDRVTPIEEPNRDITKPAPRGNPLWAVPITVLPATQARPIFSASRRPPQRAVIAPAVQAAAPPPQKPVEPERLTLSLIGVVIGPSDAVAVFVDQANRSIIRLRQSDTHAGWVLNSVQPREVTLKKDDRSEVLTIRRQEPPVAGGNLLGGPSPIRVPTTAGSNFAPFVPRSTPKNGESDGL